MAKKKPQPKQRAKRRERRIVAKVKKVARKAKTSAQPVAKATAKVASAKRASAKKVLRKTAKSLARRGVRGQPKAKGQKHSQAGNPKKPRRQLVKRQTRTPPSQPTLVAPAPTRQESPRQASGGHLAHITSVLQENRLFPPSQRFMENANISGMPSYVELVDEARRDPDNFWAGQAEALHWFKRWTKVLEWKPPLAKWFLNGKLNVAYNCLDRHLARQADKIAILWEGEPGDRRAITYRELHREVCRFANVLKKVGVQVGDRVAIYMPMIPEAAVVMLACARIGAIHSVVFGGFSADALRDRIQDAEAKVVVTADGGWRNGKIVRLKDAADEAVARCPSVETVLVFKRTGHEIKWNRRDRSVAELLATVTDDCPPIELESEHPLFILYTSGTTGKPKGILHTTGGYLLWAHLTTKWVFDMKETDRFWCTADIGWVTGHTYVVYGPLSTGATTFMYEGAPMHPQPDRFWDIIDRYRISIFYTAPTAIRAFIKAGDVWVQRHDLSSLRLLGSVGEPINPEAWMWYYRMIGRERCPIVDTWWQTETGGIMISPLPGVTATTPGSATLPLPGIEADVVDNKGKRVGTNQGGFLVIRRPWPAMLRTIWRDPARYAKQYWQQIPGMYFSGDGARIDENGYFWVMGRVDDVINVAGHRLGTAEIESALVSHPAVAEAAVVGRPDEIKGTAIVAFVIPRGRTAAQASTEPQLAEALRAHVAKEIGPIAKPDAIKFTDALPKTRSGKIMRRLLRSLAQGSALGDTTTLEDERVLEALRMQDGDEE